METRLSKKIKLGYAAASLPDAGTYLLVSTYFLFFLTTVVGVDPAIAGTVTAIGTFADAVLSPVVGYVSDNTRSKYGRRIPFIFMSAFPMTIALSLIYATVDVSSAAGIIYYILMSILFWGSFSVFFIPYLALGAELTTDYNGRTVLRSYAYVFNLLGTIVGMAMPPFLVERFVKGGIPANSAWQIVAIIISIVAFVCIMITCLTTKGKSVVKINEQKRERLGFIRSVKKMLTEYVEILKLKPVRILLGASIINLIAFTVHLSDRIYFYTFNLGLSGTAIALLMIFMTTMGLIYAPIILKLASRFDKRKILISCTCITALLIGSMRFIGIESVLAVCIFSAMFSISNTSYWQLMPATFYDICEFDELLNKKRREGILLSVYSISESVSTALALQMFGLILKFSGFDGESQVQSENALFWLSNSFSIIPAVLMLITVIFLVRFPINKEVFDEIKKQLDTGKNGAEPDLSKLKGLL